MIPEAKCMSGILQHRIHHSEEVTRNAMYRFLLNAGYQALAFLAILLIILIFMSRSAW
jgi:hypothetical protein